MLARRRFLLAGGLALAGLGRGRRLLAAAPVEIVMGASADGAHVFFDPVGLRIAPGQAVVWRCLAEVHTATAYHPANGGKPRRIPAAAAPWDSGYLKPGQAFTLTLAAPGIYDYFCRPHELAGMAGRIVVGTPDWAEYAAAGVPEAALRALPPVAAILAQGRIPGR